MKVIKISLIVVVSVISVLAYGGGYERHEIASTETADPRGLPGFAGPGAPELIGQQGQQGGQGLRCFMQRQLCDNEAIARFRERIRIQQLEEQKNRHGRIIDE